MLWKKTLKFGMFVGAPHGSPFVGLNRSGAELVNGTLRVSSSVDTQT